MLKTIVSNATLVSQNKVSVSYDNRYIKYIKPEMLAHKNVADQKSKVAGVFVCLGMESLSDFNILFRFANVQSMEAQELYSVYAEGAGLEPNKGKGSKAHNQKIADSNDALAILLEQGFYTIINFSANPQNILGSASKKYKFGKSYDDVFTLFGKPSSKVANGNRYTNFSTEGFGTFEGVVKTLSGKIAQVNPDNFVSFRDNSASFINDNIEAFKLINETESKIKEIYKSDNQDYSSVDYKELSTAKTSCAKELIAIAMQFPVASIAKGGNVNLFA